MVQRHILASVGGLFCVERLFNLKKMEARNRCGTIEEYTSNIVLLYDCVPRASDRVDSVLGCSELSARLRYLASEKL